MDSQCCKTFECGRFQIITDSLKSMLMMNYSGYVYSIRDSNGNLLLIILAKAWMNKEMEASIGNAETIMII